MNGADHYEEAERLIQVARGQHGDHYADVPNLPEVALAEAQAHATLALTAATIAVGIRNLPGARYNEWTGVIDS